MYKRNAGFIANLNIPSRNKILDKMKISSSKTRTTLILDRYHLKFNNMVLTEKDIKKLQDLNIKIELGEIRSCDNPDEKGMEVCHIYKKKKLLTTLCNETDDLLFIENTVIPYLKKLT